jgi:probable DNA metabolism protein
MNNIVFLYNDNFISLLNLIAYLQTNEIKPYNIKDTSYQPNLLEECIYPNITYNKNIGKLFIKKYNLKIFNILIYVYLANNENKELIIFYFCKNLKKYKQNIIYHQNLKCVNLALKISKYVGSENHKFKGITRFKKLENNVYYATINPTNNILYLLSTHFTNRLKNEYWIIKDVNRNLFSIYDKKKFYIISDDNFKINNKISKDESDIESLWKTFYNTIGIKERKNDRCRMNFMPKKYWQYITEMSDEL